MKYLHKLFKKHKDPDSLLQIKGALFGALVADALGVPFEFNPREKLSQNPVTDMEGYGTYDLPPGTWSDDGSLTLCLAEALTKDFNLQNVGDNFVKWFYENYWTARGEVFDIGVATREAIERLKKGKRADLAGNIEESSNGNGSLMRILPLLFLINNKSIENRYQITKQVSSITHGHIRSVISCFYYLEFTKQIIEKKDKFHIYRNLKTDVSTFLNSRCINPNEIALFNRLFVDNIFDYSEHEIKSSGYVLHTLEASIWCLLKTSNYKDAVLKAINLGSDTDTTACVTGGLAGLYYGFETIPAQWVNQIARKDAIENLAMRMNTKLF